MKNRLLYSRLLYSWDQLRASYWFIPISMAVASAILAFVLVAIDDATEIKQLPGLSEIDPPGARALLATIAAASITVTAVAFSITMVVLSTVSNQFGPRLIPNFMKHNSTQLVLGGFIGTFIYCLLVLSHVRDDSSAYPVPQLALGFGLLFGTLSFMLLIYFFRSVSRFIQVERLIEEVSSEVMNVFNRVFPNHVEDSQADNSEDDTFILPEGFQQTADGVVATKVGYIQAIDINRIVSIATEQDIVVHLLHRPGTFVFEGLRLAGVLPQEALTNDISERIRSSFLIGGQRTSMQDPEFAVDQLVEVSMRALSPGINDSFTAISCIDRLGAGLSFLGTRLIPSRLHHDGNGQLRVITQPFTYASIGDAAFNQIRQTAKANCAVTIRLLEVIDSVAQRDLPGPYRKALKRHAQLIYQGSLETFFRSGDASDLNQRYDQVMHSLADRNP
ncbi:MAG: DUF2254 domain-containing protein [Dehalococcoidia bacterium]|nr:DUF2254 domain-containing protein [Dehalococcoidia bacterium]